MMTWIIAFLDRAFAVIGALLFLQTPMFIQQYLNQLSGHVYELKFQMNAIENAATQNGKTLSQYIQKFLSSNDVDFVSQGAIMQGMVERAKSLSDAYQSILSTSVYAKPFVFLQHLDWDILKTTYAHFQFGIPLTLEGLVYGLIGIFLGYIIFQAISLSFRSIYQTFTSPKKITASN